jgi:hypothetical protein
MSRVISWSIWWNTCVRAKHYMMVIPVYMSQFLKVKVLKVVCQLMHTCHPWNLWTMLETSQIWNSNAEQ